MINNISEFQPVRVENYIFQFLAHLAKAKISKKYFQVRNAAVLESYDSNDSGRVRKGIWLPYTHFFDDASPDKPFLKAFLLYYIGVYTICQ
jgi:hypothetical protein